jgi:hypothetical protein
MVVGYFVTRSDNGDLMFIIGKIVYKPTPHVRQPKMYLNRNRVCRKCGNNRTNDKLINHVLWYRDMDEQGKWTGKYLCNKCYHGEYGKKREKEIALMRQKFIEDRNSKLEKIEKLDKGNIEEIEENAVV